MLQDQKKGLSQDEIDIIDLNERPEAAAGRFISFVNALKDVGVKDMKLASGAGQADTFSKEFEKYLAALCQRSSNTFYYTYGCEAENAGGSSEGSCSRRNPQHRF